MKPYLTTNFYNPSATYLAGRSARAAVETARAKVAAWLGARPAEIIFTAGATEANNLAISGLMRQFPDGEVLLSAIEHKSVLEPAKAFRHKIVPVDSRGLVDLAKLEKLIGDRTVLISVGLVNNELGTVQPLREIATLIKTLWQRRASKSWPLYLHTDAAQAPNYFDLHISRLGVDLLSLNGGKIYGPKQSGALYAASRVNLSPLIVGGGQEHGLRSGTENVAAIVGLARALDIAQTKRSASSKRQTALRTRFIDELLEAVPQAVVNGDPKRVAPHIISLSFPGIDNERLMMQLDEAGVQVALGSACSAASVEPSHVLSAIGLSNALARATLRISLGRGSSAALLSRTVKLFKKFTNSSR